MSKPRRHAPKRKRCKATGKIRYRDGDDAALALRLYKRQATQADQNGVSHKIKVVRKYRCTECGGWHLTSQPGKDSG